MASERLNILIDIRSKLANLERAKRGFTVLATKVAAFAAAYVGVRQVIRGGRDIIKLGADLDHLSAQTSVAVGELLILKQAFEDNGISSDKLGKSINKMQRSIVEAGEGLSEPVKAFEELNINIEDLKDLSPSEQFDTIAKAIGKIEDPAARATAAMRIFGRSGAELQSLFLAGDIEDTARSLGMLPEVLERNSKELERIDTIMGRLSGKGRQLFAGIADQLSTELLGPLERLNSMDFTPIGQRLGALIGIFVDAFGSGELGDLIALTIEAGFEQGAILAKKSFSGIGKFLSPEGEFWPDVINGLVTFGNSVAKMILDVFAGMRDLSIAIISKPLSFLAAGFRKIGQEVKQSFSEFVNFLSKRLENLINRIIRKVNELTKAIPGYDGTSIKPVSVGRVNVVNAQSYSDILKDQQAAQKAVYDVYVSGTNDLIEKAKSGLDYNTRRTREILGIQKEVTNENDKQLTASERFMAKINARIEAVSAQKDAAAEANAAQEEAAKKATAAQTKTVSSIEKTTKATEHLADAAKNKLSYGFENAFMSIIDGSQTASGAFRSMAASMLNDMARMGMRSITQSIFGVGTPGLAGGIFGGGGGASGGFSLGSIFSNLFHEGGKVGVEGRGRMVSPEIFAGAPRFHRGGIVGGEVPAILKKGEFVFTPEQMKAMNNMSGPIVVNTTINMNDDGSSDVKSDGKRMRDLEDGIVAVVKKTLVDERSRPGGLLA